MWRMPTVISTVFVLGEDEIMASKRAYDEPVRRPQSDERASSRSKQRSGTPSSVAELRVTAFYPQRAEAGAIVTLVGACFGEDPNLVEVLFAGSRAEVVSIFDTGIVVRAPAAASGPIVVSRAGRSVSTLEPFIMTTEPISPAIADVVPRAVEPWGTLVITGEGLSGSRPPIVRVNGLALRLLSFSDTKIEAIVGKDATSGPVSVTTVAGTATFGEVVVVR